MHCYDALECAFTYKQPIGVVYKHALDLGLLGREMETFEQLLQPRVEFVVAVVGVNHGRCQQHFCITYYVIFPKSTNPVGQRKERTKDGHKTG